MPAACAGPSQNRAGDSGSHSALRQAGSAFSLESQDLAARRCLARECWKEFIQNINRKDCMVTSAGEPSPCPPSTQGQGRDGSRNMRHRRLPGGFSGHPQEHEKKGWSPPGASCERWTWKGHESHSSPVHCGQTALPSLPSFCRDPPHSPAPPPAFQPPPTAPRVCSPSRLPPPHTWHQAFPKAF